MLEISDVGRVLKLSMSTFLVLEDPAIWILKSGLD
jgi:hypothetical protein